MDALLSNNIGQRNIMVMFSLNITWHVWWRVPSLTDVLQ